MILVKFTITQVCKGLILFALFRMNNEYSKLILKSDSLRHELMPSLEDDRWYIFSVVSQLKINRNLKTLIRVEVHRLNERILTLENENNVRYRLPMSEKENRRHLPEEVSKKTTSRKKSGTAKRRNADAPGGIRGVTVERSEGVTRAGV
ncbi:hypothetical protein K0M31_017291 [Melipona bicolor]|uniref:Uncharacterized protein n=1 Tax=Melipona bicolor TaxID=60889 RepID=A0AA40G531_9HYME|nr:hypothetical protein K0M31_017291 [Melipona bicolor]